jgi:chemotaxis protein histidine kinase CheA
MLYSQIQTDLGPARLKGFVDNLYQAGLNSTVEVEAKEGDGMSVFYYMLTKFSGANVHLRTINMKNIEDLIKEMETGNVKRLCQEIKTLINVGVDEFNYKARADCTTMPLWLFMSHRYGDYLGDELKMYKDGGFKRAIDPANCTTDLLDMIEKIATGCKQMENLEPGYWKKETVKRSRQAVKQKQTVNKDPKHRSGQGSKQDQKHHKGQARPKKTEQKGDPSQEHKKPRCQRMKPGTGRCEQKVTKRKPPAEGFDRLCLECVNEGLNNKPCSFTLCGSEKKQIFFRAKEEDPKAKKAKRAEKQVSFAEEGEEEDEEGPSKKKKKKTKKKVNSAFKEAPEEQNFNSAPLGDPETASEGAGEDPGDEDLYYVEQPEEHNGLNEDMETSDDENASMPPGFEPSGHRGIYIPKQR